MEPNNPHFIHPPVNVLENKTGFKKPINFLYALLVITIIGSSTSLFFLQKINKIENQTETTDSFTLNSVKSNTTSSYSEPGCCHIVGAKTEKIALPGYESADIEIVDSIDGVSDNVIQQINDRITNSVFDKIIIKEKTNNEITDFDTTIVDVRDPKNRKTLPGEDVNLFFLDALNSKILYIDKGLVIVSGSHNIFYNGAAHSDRGSYISTFVIDGTGKKLLEPKIFTKIKPVMDDNYNFSPNQNELIIKHFYPDYKKTLSEFVEREGRTADEENSCYSIDDDIVSYYPDVDPIKKLVAFKQSWGYAMNGVCDPNSEAFVVPFSRLNEIEQYIPNDSILRRFMN